MIESIFLLFELCFYNESMLIYLEYANNVLWRVKRKDKVKRKRQEKKGCNQTSRFGFSYCLQLRGVRERQTERNIYQKKKKRQRETRDISGKC
jgi:hypothetical protein